MNRFEQCKVLRYMHNVLRSKQTDSKSILRFLEWHFTKGQQFIPYKWNVSEFDETDKFFDIDDLSKENKKSVLKQVPKFCHALAEKADSIQKLGKSSEELCLENLRHVLGLSEEEKEILGIVVRFAVHSELSDIFDTILPSSFLYVSALKLLSGYRSGLVDRIIRFDSALIKYGLIKIDYDGEIKLSNFCQNIFALKIHTPKDLHHFILGQPLAASLDWNDFSHIEDKEFCAEILHNALLGREKGINILLYGEPGTGKTEFAKTLCRKKHIQLYDVAAAEGEDDRKKYLELAQKIIRPGQKLCLLIDEADDVFANKKIVVNRMLENNSIPRIWIINSIDFLDKAYLRRFTYAMHFEKPVLEVRTKMWQKCLKNYRMNVSADTARNFAKEYRLPPSFIGSAVKGALLAGGGTENIKLCIGALEKAYRNGEKAVSEVQKKPFNPCLLNTDTDLNLLADRLKKLGKRSFSLCLYGASGTGKSAYAEYLADVLGMNVIKKQCSSLLDKFVGGTEQNIAAAFREAKENEAMLILDEADSFLRDRNHAVRSWEATQVNEMLTQMEQFPYPFVCTTNLMDKLDKASLRRFTFKVRYDFMKKEQVREAFKFFFGKTVQNCGQFRMLTPGDFAVVKNKAEILNLLDDEKELQRMLMQEEQAKCLKENAVKLGFV